MRVEYTYPARGKQPPVKLVWYQGNERPMVLIEAQRKQWKSGVLFVGEKGKLFSNYGSYRLMPEDQFKVPAAAQDHSRTIGHHAEWVKACREGGRMRQRFQLCRAAQ